MGAKSILLAMAMGAAAFPSSAVAEAWKHKGDKLVTTVGIKVPAKPAGLSLREATEFSHKGKSLDNVAQFETTDKAIAASAYVYRPSYPDAALTAMQTARVMERRFGKGLELTSASLVGAAGIPNSVIRRIYDHRAEGRTTTAAFLKAGDWIVKLRVSGPYSRREEIIAALDALISGLELPDQLEAAPVAELQLSECAVSSNGRAKKASVAEGLGLESNSMTEALISGVFATVLEDQGKPGEKRTVAHNGLQALCVRDRVMIEDFDMPLLQEVGDTAKPGSIVLVFNDAGGVIEMPLRDGNYHLLVHEIGKTTNYGAYDRPLAPEQLVEILTGGDKTARVHSVISFDSDGKASTQIFVPADAVSNASTPGAPPASEPRQAR